MADGREVSEVRTFNSHGLDCALGKVTLRDEAGDPIQWWVCYCRVPEGSELYRVPYEDVGDVGIEWVTYAGVGVPALGVMGGWWVGFDSGLSFLGKVPPVEDMVDRLEHFAAVVASMG